MITQKEAQEMYDNKFFYEVVPGEEGSIDHTLVGPLDNIRFLVPYEDRRRSQEFGQPEYAFAQVINGKVVAAFTKEEIVVLDFDIRNSKRLKTKGV